MSREQKRIAFASRAGERGLESVVSQNGLASPKKATPRWKDVLLKHGLSLLKTTDDAGKARQKLRMFVPKLRPHSKDHGQKVTLVIITCDPRISLELC